MTWVDTLPVAVAVLYLITAVGYKMQGQMGLSAAYTAYALANAGLVWAAIEGRVG